MNRASELQFRFKLNKLDILLVLLLVIFHFILLWSMLARQLDPFFNDAKHRLGRGTDFSSYYNAGVGMLSGKGAYGHGPGFGFRYHPLFAAVFGIIFSRLGIYSAYVIWCILHELGFFWIWSRLQYICSNRQQFFVFSMLLVFFSPYYLEVYMGNASFLSSVILFKVVQLISQKKHLAANLLLFVSIVIKPIGIVLLPLQIIQGRWRSVIMISTMLVISAVPFFWKDLQALYNLMSLNLMALPMKGWVVHGGNQGFHAFLVDICARFSGFPISQLSSYSDLPKYCSFVVQLLPLVLLVLTFIVSLKIKEHTYFLAFLWLSTYLLGYKDIWEHTYSICIVVFLCAWMSHNFPKGLLLCAVVLMALPTAFVFYDLPLPAGPNDPERYWNVTVSFFHHLTKPIGILIPYGYAIWKTLKSAKLESKIVLNPVEL